MIRKLSHMTVYVLDQDRAHDFYTQKLGFEVRDGVKLGNFRWLTVGPKMQPDIRLVLMPIGMGPSADPASAEKLRELVKAGAFGAGVFHTEDCRRTYDELKAKGVRFLKEPQEMPYGIEAMLSDDSGNVFSLTQPR